MSWIKKEKLYINFDSIIFTVSVLQNALNAFTRHVVWFVQHDQQEGKFIMYYSTAQIFLFFTVFLCFLSSTSGYDLDIRSLLHVGSI